MENNKFYEITQNNSGGSFAVNDKLCHRLFIEAKSEKEATRIAEDLGCYWDGVDKGIDCECCGDRWYGVDEVDLNNINTKWNGYEVSFRLDSNKKNENINKDVAIQNLKAIYPGATWLKEPIYSSTRVIGRIKLDNIEQYAQVMANLYGQTTPDCRIFYKNGEVKEIFTK
jgi:hypothetical protein